MEKSLLRQLVEGMLVSMFDGAYASTLLFIAFLTGCFEATVEKAKTFPQVQEIKWDLINEKTTKVKEVSNKYLKPVQNYCQNHYQWWKAGGPTPFKDLDEDFIENLQDPAEDITDEKNVEKLLVFTVLQMKIMNLTSTHPMEKLVECVVKFYETNRHQKVLFVCYCFKRVTDLFA